MQLYASPTSPFARLARSAVRALGLIERVEEVMVSPWDNPDELLRANPSARVPALVTDAGTPIAGSPVIVQFLLDEYGPGELLPEGRREHALHKYGLGLALMEDTVSIIATGRLTEDGPPPALVERRTAGIDRGLERLAEDLPPEAARDPDIGDLAVAIALEYLDLRMESVAWRGTHDNLRRWHQSVRERDSLASTRPPT